MFRLVYSGDGATQPLVDDFSITRKQKWQLLLDRNWRACQAGIPDDGAKFPSQPYIAGVTSRAKTATAEARQWLVAVCWQSTLAGNALEVS
ncbi:hypothetical protein ABBQ32_006894 [Trebouxia sp. C0010 RCD-2024]